MAASKPMWTENCPEQKQLDQLFEAKKIDESSVPNNIRKNYPEFMAFPSRTFAAHFRKTKAKYGIFADNAQDDEIGIPELDGSPPNETNKKRKVVDGSGSGENCENSDITFNNPPHLIWTYTDHEEKVDIVCVAVPAISGSQNVDFNLSEDGMKLIIKYTWPMSMYTPALLYSKNVAMTMSHPQIHSLSSHLIKQGYSVKSRPIGNIVVSLPVKVQREVGSWSYEGMTINGADILLVQFKAFQKKLIIDDADTSVTFQ